MNDKCENINGTVLEIQRMSTEDGPGIRTTVFMKGCTLKCSWCHNPESISFKQELQWIKTDCIECGICIDLCPSKALSFKDNDVIIDREKCKICNICSKECPTGALELIGSKWNVENLVEELLKDRAYFEKSAGGVTISGGEPAMQPDFVVEVLKKLKKQGIHVALDSCGMSSEESFIKILPHVDLVLFDIKEIDSVKHKEFTGSSNEQILSNLKFVDNYIKNHKDSKSLWIRTPIIPDATATENNILGITKFLSENRIEYDRWELCSFNNLCNDKYVRLNIDWEFKNYHLFDSKTMDRLLAVAKENSSDSKNIIWTGSVKTEVEDFTSETKKSEFVDYCKITSVGD